MSQAWIPKEPVSDDTKRKVSLYECYAHTIYEMVKLHIPKYSSRFSRKEFTYQQLLAAAIYGRSQEMAWRDIEQHLLCSDRIANIFEFTAIPTHKTLWKAFDKTDGVLFDKLFEESKTLFTEIRAYTRSSNKSKEAIIDSTGYKEDSASFYYSKRAGKKA